MYTFPQAPQVPTCLTARNPRGKQRPHPPAGHAAFSHSAPPFWRLGWEGREALPETHRVGRSVNPFEPPPFRMARGGLDIEPCPIGHITLI